VNRFLGRAWDSLVGLIVTFIVVGVGIAVVLAFVYGFIYLLNNNIWLAGCLFFLCCWIISFFMGEAGK
jgi:hypothetical protein